MKSRTKLIVGISLIAAATGLVIYTRRRYKRNIITERKKRQALEVAEHGYETAHDILFPNKGIRKSKYRSA